MRYGHVLLSVLACALVREGSAGGRAATGATAGHVYIAPGSQYYYAAVRVARPAELMGAIAARAAQDAWGPSGSAPVPPVTGEASPDVPPDGWREGAEDALTAMQRGTAPFSAAGAGARCDCTTVLGDTDRERIAALYATREFEVGDEIDDIVVLSLRVRYRAGLVAHLNGREVARRHIDAGSDQVAFATRPRGPEWETFHIRVVPGLLRKGKNVLAIEVRPSPRDPAPVLDLELTGGVSARLVRGPMVQRVGPTSAAIVFDTDVPTTGAVEYGPTAELGSVARSADGALAVHHVVELTDLPEGEPVHYRVRAGSATSEPLVFHTTPVAGEPVRIAIYGDVRGGHDVHRRIVESMLDDAPDLVAVTGDMVLRGSDEGDWQRFFDVTRQLLSRVPYYPAVGNHDMGRTGDELRRVNEIFSLWPGPPDRPEWGAWYSFDVSGVHLAMLDSNSYEHAEQREWLERDLADARARGVRAIFVFTHAGPYSRGIHGGSDVAVRDYVPILREHGVTLLFSGHDHLYQRGRVRGLDYVVTGGGGASLYSIRCGTSGRNTCGEEDGMLRVERAHHYLLLTVYEDRATLCPRRPDGSALEACVRYRLDGGH